ncbi:hypothetical protein N3K66_000057 [Trichothecium roseum]|uniref:Uncharacterized protein n=1 Tax=Trichothecium roseum TaxID=47278 RepID=A0ACC0VCN7_9HYPO|nr:hypothetical protein N3K66_000057 [Trichothecium roseum]
MPSTIPYDPSLVLGMIVDHEILENVKAMADAQALSDAMQDELNAMIASRRSLDMTKAELLNLGVDVSDINDALNGDNGLNKRITEKAKAYCAAKIKAEEEIENLRINNGKVKYTPESPVDFVKTEIKSMPLATDSINMDVQYFSLDTNKESSDTFAKQIGGFVSASTSWMGTSYSAEMSSKAQSQISQQMKLHSISGTLVLSVSCTHKNTALLAPLILNVDKGIKVWNHYFPDQKIDPTKPKEMVAAANNDDSGNEKPDSFTIISGVSYGSSFVGMVHVLNTTQTDASQSMNSITSSLQAQMNTGGWFSKFSGGFGVNSAFSNSVKNMLSSQNVTSHVTITCMGTIPSIASNQVQLGVAGFADSDPAKDMEALARLQNATAADQETIQQSAEAARTGQQMVAMKGSQIESTLSALAQIDDQSNKILDINSMMAALEDYISKVTETDTGVPLNYYLKDISKDMLAEMWVAKYYPDQYMVINWDDSDPKEAAMNVNAEKAPALKALEMRPVSANQATRKQLTAVPEGPAAAAEGEVKPEKGGPGEDDKANPDEGRANENEPEVNG